MHLHGHREKAIILTGSKHVVQCRLLLLSICGSQQQLFSMQCHIRGLQQLLVGNQLQLPHFHHLVTQKSLRHRPPQQQVFGEACRAFEDLIDLAGTGLSPTRCRQVQYTYSSQLVKTPIVRREPPPPPPPPLPPTATTESRKWCQTCGVDSLGPRCVSEASYVFRTMPCKLPMASSTAVFRSSGASSKRASSKAVSKSPAGHGVVVVVSTIYLFVRKMLR